MSLAVRAFAWVVVAFLSVGLGLFWPAGTLAWPAGWIFLLLLTGFLAVGAALLLKFNPSLLEERIKLNQPNQKAWDKVFLVMFDVFFYIWTVLMAFDAVRFHWSHMPLLLQVIGTIAIIVSFFLMGLTFRENTYLSPMVRIQGDRGQTVISTGPYHYVRHPLYAGAILLILGTPLLLGSWYGLLIAVFIILGCSVRAILEERTLRDELPGYAAYMNEVKYRLIPYVW